MIQSHPFHFSPYDGYVSPVAAHTLRVALTIDTDIENTYASLFPSPSTNRMTVLTNIVFQSHPFHFSPYDGYISPRAAFGPTISTFNSSMAMAISISDIFKVKSDLCYGSGMIGLGIYLDDDDSALRGVSVSDIVSDDHAIALGVDDDNTSVTSPSTNSDLEIPIYSKGFLYDSPLDF